MFQDIYDVMELIKIFERQYRTPIFIKKTKQVKKNFKQLQRQHDQRKRLTNK